MKKHMNIKYVTILLILSFISVKAQENRQFSDYKLNRSIFNPAFGGFFDGSVLLLNRSQFTGIEGAPKNINLNINAPLSLNMGMAFNILNEKLGVTEQISFAADYSYTVYLGEVNMLTFGIKGGISNLNIDYSRLDLDDNTDSNFANNVENKILPQVGIGFLFNTENWYFGLSSPNFIKHDYNTAISSSTIAKSTAIFLNTGFNMELNRDLIFEPSVLAKYVQGTPLAIDFAFNFEYLEKFRFGTSYRWDNAVTGLVGFNLVEDFQVGYAYDYNINALGTYAASSHQFYLKYTFKRPKELFRQWQL